MNRAELLIDLSQFVGETVRSGIQRVLVELIRRWPTDMVSADVGYRDSEGYTIVSLEGARSAVQGYFDDDAENAHPGQVVGGVKRHLDQLATAKIPTSDLAKHFSAYLLPELTFRSEVLDMLHQWNSIEPQRTFAIFYDALPLTESSALQRAAPDGN